MFRRFYGYMKDYRKYGLFSCACVALEVMFELVIPLVMADIIDVGVADLRRCAARGWERSFGRRNIRRSRASLFPIQIISPHRLSLRGLPAM